MKKFSAFCVCISLVISLTAQRYDDELPKEQNKKLVFSDGFETGCWDVTNGSQFKPDHCPGKGKLWKHSQMQGMHSGKIVSDTVRSGDKAMRFMWLKDDPGKWDGNPKVSNNEKKAMLHAAGVKENQGSERWYGWSIYFPAEGMKKDDYPSLFFQLHATPDHDLKEPWRQPPAAMSLTNEGMEVDWTYDGEKVSPKNKNIKENRTTVKIPGPHESYLNRWVDIVWHVKVDYTEASQGLIEVWIDGKKVVDEKNIRLGYNDDLGLYPSFGMYWYTGKATHNHWVYVDEIAIGGPKAGYKDVAP